MKRNGTRHCGGTGEVGDGAGHAARVRGEARSTAHSLEFQWGLGSGPGHPHTRGWKSPWRSRERCADLQPPVLFLPPPFPLFHPSPGCHVGSHPLAQVCWPVLPSPGRAAEGLRGAGGAVGRCFGVNTSYGRRLMTICGLSRSSWGVAVRELAGWLTFGHIAILATDVGVSYLL